MYTLVSGVFIAALMFVMNMHVSAQEIGLVTAKKNGNMVVEDIDGRQIYNGNGARLAGELMGYSSQIIVFQRENGSFKKTTTVFTFEDGELVQLYSSNEARGSVVNVAGLSFFTKDDGWDCKYTIQGNRLITDYCRTRPRY